MKTNYELRGLAQDAWVKLGYPDIMLELFRGIIDRLPAPAPAVEPTISDAGADINLPILSHEQQAALRGPLKVMGGTPATEKPRAEVVPHELGWFARTKEAPYSLYSCGGMASKNHWVLHRLAYDPTTNRIIDITEDSHAE